MIKRNLIRNITKIRSELSEESLYKCDNFIEYITRLSTAEHDYFNLRFNLESLKFHNPINIYNRSEYGDFETIINKENEINKQWENINLSELSDTTAKETVNQEIDNKAKEEPKQEEKAAYDIKLTGFDAAKKLQIIKELKTMLKIGLKESKELVDKCPSIIQSNISTKEANELKSKLESFGCTIELV